MSPWIVKNFPIVSWLPGYDRRDLRGDVVAGVTVAVMLIPQGMAYAMLAGLPPIVGLYASILPLVAYAFFGTSRQLAVGPVAMDSLLVATGVGAIAQGGTELYLTLAAVVALLTGIIQLAMGALRLGFVVNFLSHPVISGFTSAAALIIGLSQLKHLLGIDLARSRHIHDILIEAVQRAGEVDPGTLAVGVGAVVVLVAMKKLRPRFPSALLVVVLGTLAVWGLHLDVKIVGEVPRGLPGLTLPHVDLATAEKLLPSAFVIALVAFMEAIAVAKVYATKNRYTVDPNQELKGLGAANVVAALTGGYSVTGGFSRTAVNAQAGANTPLASLVTAGLIAVALLTITPLFYFLPKAVLAAIVMVAVFGLIDLKTPLKLARTHPVDAGLLGLTFLATLTLGIEQGIGVGVAASLGVFVLRSTRPHTAVLGRLPGSDVYRNVDRYPEAEIDPEVVALRIDASFYFGNAAFLKERIEGLAAAPKPPRAVVIDASSVNYIDASGAEALDDIARTLEAAHVRLVLAGVKGPVHDVLCRTGLIERLGGNATRGTIAEAMALLQAKPSAPRAIAAAA